jgi:hypothetical protein
LTDLVKLQSTFTNTTLMGPTRGRSYGFLILIMLLLHFPLFLSAQQMLQYKKGRHEKKHWWTSEVFTFRTKDGVWRQGILIKVTPDSFLLSNRVIRYGLIGTDTSHFGESMFAFNEVEALPKHGYPIDYLDGGYKVNPRNGGMYFYWFKSGYLFRLGALTYTGLWLANSAIQHDIMLQNSHLGWAAGVYALGFLMKRMYKPYITLKGKHHLEGRPL